MSRVVNVLVVVVMGLGKHGAEKTDGVGLDPAVEHLNGDEADRLAIVRRGRDEGDFGAGVGPKSDDDMARPLGERDVGDRI